MKQVLFIIVIVAMQCSCSSYNASLICADADTINIDKATEESEIYLSSIVDKPLTIVLETNDNCIVQNVRSIELYDEKIYILDDMSNKLYVFNMDGSFDKNIAEAGRGHGEYLELADFSIDRKKGEMYLFDEAMDAILKYDIKTGKFICSTNTARDGYRTYCMQFLDDKFYLNKTSIDNNNMYELKEVSPNNGEITNKYLKSAEYNMGWNIPLRLPYSNFYSKNTDCPKYVGMFSNTIVGMTSSGIIPQYIVLSDDFITSKDVAAVKEKISTENYFIDMEYLGNANKIYQISRIVEMPGKLLFQYMKGLRRMYLLYDVDKKESQTTGMLVNDYVSDENNVPMDLCYSDDKGVVSILQTNHISYFVENFIQKGKVKKDIDKYDKLMGLTENSNPVLFYHRYKK